MITISYDNSKAKFNLKSSKIPINGKIMDIDEDIDIPIPLQGAEPNVGRNQKLIRELDILKDGIEGGMVSMQNMRDIISKVYGESFTQTLNVFDTLKTQINGYNQKNFLTHSWVRNATISTALDLKYIFQESGLSPEEYTIPGFKYVNTFASIADPASRSIPNIQWPGQNIKLEFRPSFMEYFGFLPGSSWEAIQTNNMQDNNALYNFRINVGNNNILESSNINVNNIMDFSRAFQGNIEKNSYIKKILSGVSSVETIPTTELNEIIKDIISKEMGDVMQVLVFFVWIFIMNYFYKLTKIVCAITTGDEVVDLLAQYIEVPCILWSASVGGLRYIRQYIPNDVSPEERCKTAIEQTYIAIKQNNEAILKIMEDYLDVISGPVGGNMIEVELTYYSGKNKFIEILNIHGFIISALFNSEPTLIIDTIKIINKELKTYYESLDCADSKIVQTYSVEIEFIKQNFFVFPLVSLKKKPPALIPTLLTIDGTLTNITGSIPINKDDTKENLYIKYERLAKEFGISKSNRSARKRVKIAGGSPKFFTELCNKKNIKNNIKEIINDSGLVFRIGLNDNLKYGNANEYEEELILIIVEILCRKFTSKNDVLKYLFYIYNLLTYLFFLIDSVIVDHIELNKIINEILLKKNLNLYNFAQKLKNKTFISSKQSKKKSNKLIKTKSIKTKSIKTKSIKTKSIKTKSIKTREGSTRRTRTRSSRRTREGSTRRTNGRSSRRTNGRSSRRTNGRSSRRTNGRSSRKSE
jgi:hypothetical protein